MVTFHVSCRVENTVDRGRSARVARLLVDTGNEHTWGTARTLEGIGILPEKKDVPFVMANGQQITRRVGFSVVHVGRYFTVDEVVFAEKGDLQHHGARTLEGMNVRVDSGRKKLVVAGPLPAASARPTWRIA